MQDDSAAASLKAASQAATTAYNNFVGRSRNLRTTITNVTATFTLSNNSILYGSILTPNGAITVSINSTVHDGVLVSGKNISLDNSSVSTAKTPWLPPSDRSQGGISGQLSP